MSKEEMLRTTSASVAIGIIQGIVDTVEDFSEEQGLDLSDFSVPWRLIDLLREDPWRVLEDGNVSVYSSRASQAYTREVTVAGSIVAITIEPGYGEAGFRELYSEPVKVLRLDREMLRERAVRTTRTGIEYMFLYLSDGRVAMFEGEHFRVRLPFVESSASVHTHPEGACGLSVADIQSGLDLLVSGGLLSAAATPSCIAFMHRLGLVSEDDYFAVKEAIYRRRVQDLFGPSRLRTIVFGVAPY